MKKNNFATLIIGCMFILSMIGCGEKQVDVQKEQEVVSQSIIEQNENSTILKAIAQDASDLTGTYVDKELELKIVLVQQNNLVTYNFCAIDDTEPFIEVDCKIESGYIAGQYYYISKNMDGTLAISSGSGGAWGSFEKISDEAIIDLQAYYNELEESVGVSGDLAVDVANGLLYADIDGTIVDSNAIPIPEYSYIIALENGALSDGDSILEGVEVDKNGKIVNYTIEVVDYDVENDVHYSNENEEILWFAGVYSRETTAPEGDRDTVTLTQENTIDKYEIGEIVGTFLVLRGGIHDIEGELIKLGNNYFGIYRIGKIISTMSVTENTVVLYDWYGFDGEYYLDYLYEN